MRNIDQPEATSFLPLHPLEVRILLGMMEGPVHGYRLVSAIEESEPTWNRIFPANLYRRVRTLIRDGLVEEGNPPDDEQVSRRKYFQITELGRNVLIAETARMRALLAETERKGLGPAMDPAR